MVYDLSMKALQVPGLRDYTPELGTLKEIGTSLTTLEVVNNMSLPYRRKFLLTDGDTVAGPVEADATICYTATSSQILDLKAIQGKEGVRLDFILDGTGSLELLLSNDGGDDNTVTLNSANPICTIFPRMITDVQSGWVAFLGTGGGSGGDSTSEIYTFDITVRAEDMSQNAGTVQVTMSPEQRAIASTLYAAHKPVFCRLTITMSDISMATLIMPPASDSLNSSLGGGDPYNGYGYQWLDVQTEGTQDNGYVSAVGTYSVAADFDTGTCTVINKVTSMRAPSSGGAGGDTGNTVDYYVIEIEANFDGIKPNEPLRFEGDLDPDVASGITEAVAAGKALMLKIVDSSTDGSSPSTTIVITNYSYNDAGVYSFDMNDATITGNQIIVVDYNASIRPDLGDYSGYATLSTVTVPEGGGAVVPSESSNAYVLQLTYEAEFDADVAVTIALTPEQNAAVTDAITNRVPIIAIVTSADGLSTVLTPIYTTASDGGGVGILSNTLMSLSRPGAPNATTVTLNLDTDAGSAQLKIESADLGGSGGSGGNGNTGDNVYVLNITADTPYDGNAMVDETLISTATLSEQQWSDLESALATGKSVVVNADFGSGFVLQCNRVFGNDISSIVCAGTLIGAGEGQIFNVQQAQVANFKNRKCGMYYSATMIDWPTGGGSGGGGTGGGAGGDTGNTATNCEQFTYVIDSNEKLAEWANNDRSKGQDYTSVLVKKGEWRCVLPDKGQVTPDPDREPYNVAYINLVDIGTKYMYGEAGNKLILESPYSGTGGTDVEQLQSLYMVYGLCGQDLVASIEQQTPVGIRDFTMCNVNIEAIGESHYFNATFGLPNLYNCNVVLHASGGYPVASCCYSACRNVNSCSGSVHVNATGTPDSPVIGAGGCSVFSVCYAVSKCYISARCTVATEGVEADEEEASRRINTFDGSYASWSPTNEYACADTPAGGFNNITNPST